jgi:hypothetical protein
MITPPPTGARPTLEHAAVFAFLWPIGLALASFAQSLGGGSGAAAGDMAIGHVIVAGIMALPFLIVTLGRLAPELTAPWGQGDALFFGAVRASLFLTGFVLIYQGVGWALSKDMPTGWKLGAAVSAAAVLSWYALLSLGPWRRRP